MWLVVTEEVKGLFDGVDILKGERILMEMSRKFTPEDIRQLAFQSNFYVQVGFAVIVCLIPIVCLDVTQNTVACIHMLVKLSRRWVLLVTLVAMMQMKFITSTHA